MERKKGGQKNGCGKAFWMVECIFPLVVVAVAVTFGWKIDGKKKENQHLSLSFCVSYNVYSVIVVAYCVLLYLIGLWFYCFWFDDEPHIF